MLQNYDAIVVLGGGITKDGILSDVSTKRAEKGVKLFQELKARALIFSGRWSLTYKFIPNRTEAQAFKELAIKLGVEQPKILLEEESLDTLGNAYFVKKKILEPKEWKQLLIVTSDFHVKRTSFAFKKVLGSEYKMDFVGVQTKKIQWRCSLSGFQKASF